MGPKSKCPRNINKNNEQLAVFLLKKSYNDCPFEAGVKVVTILKL